MNAKTFEKAKEIILNKNGKCYSDNISNQYAEIEVECNKNHKWKTNSKNINNGKWCIKCLNIEGVRLKNKFAEIKIKVESRGGRVVSNEYFGRTKALEFECDKGHRWFANWQSISKNHWCHICAKIKTNIYTIYDVKKICKDKYGECLSEEYSSKKMHFKCKFNHEWFAKPYNILKKDSWCPICASGLYERICRLYFETLFEKQFVKIKPDWLINKAGNPIELDGYCEELKIAFEHNGKQHYEKVNFNNKISNLEKIKSNDEDKVLLCKDNNIKLIIIPELNSMLKIKDLKSFIKKECIKNNINLPINYDEIVVDHNLAYANCKDLDNLNELKESLYKNNFELISTKYCGVYSKYEARCLNCNNIKNVIYASLKKGCSKCQANKKRKSIKDLEDLASLKEGYCLATEYKNNHTKILWRCKLDHEWQASYNQVQSGKWCPYCFKLNINGNYRKKILKINIYKEAAIKKGGICLSEDIKSCYDKLTCRCNKGHEWKIRADALKNTKRWCPTCAILNKKVKCQ
jgi:hypothetical protein